MKLTKTSWLIITIGIFIIAFTSLAAVRYRQISQQKQLNDELASVELELTKVQPEQLSSQYQELERRLSQTLAQLETAKAEFSPPIESIDTNDILFDIAREYGVRVAQITLSDDSSYNSNGVAYSIETFSVTIEGNTLSLINFITRLNNDLATGVVKSVAISIPGMSSEENTSADIQLIMHTYRGDW